MNRSDLRELARERVREARQLLRARAPNGAYYLAGYAVECALKACIAKKTQRYEFPSRDTVNESHTHDLNRLLSWLAWSGHLSRRPGRVLGLE